MTRSARALTIAFLAGLVMGGLAIPAASAVEGDPGAALQFGRQWNLKAIHAEAAWDIAELGSADVTVAVLDTGIDTRHPDLEGLVDLERSKSLIKKSVKCPVGDPGTPSGTEEDRDAITRGLPKITDFHGHGTGVSALISSNAVHLAGVTQKTTLIGVKVHDRGRRNCLSIYLDAVKFAADNDADVIHMSFPLEFSKTAFPGAAERVNDMMDYAHRKGAVLVAAAGNDGRFIDPAADVFRFCVADHVICVSATGPATAADLSAPAWDARATYTNFGPAIFVAGPGGTTASADTQAWLVCAQQSLVLTGPPSLCRTAPHLVWRSTGTSFGAAATSGLLALLVDRIGSDRPDDIREALRQSVEDLGDPGFDDVFGHGRIDVAKALEASIPAP
jgi:serine protease